ncbi:MAG: YihY/virulence factor BrkB family protein [Deltaproteobacteria bacterium]|nr:YihY/virulence factor BrkB family protein [Deltaproteobacteria bacterium]MBW2134262.1 YihY/virulence factor BrkB family protein [Deltaproteobacteria bacterium]
MDRLFTQVQNFIQVTLWQYKATGLGQVGLQVLRIGTLAVWGLIRNQAMVQASTLAYYTMLALVPLMALLFAVFKGLGLQHLLADYLLERLAPGSQDFAHQVLDYIENADVAGLGAMGVASLLLTLVLVMNNVERAINLTWGVTQTRPWRRRISDYFSIFLLLPILVAVAGTFSSAFLGLPEVQQLLTTLSPGLYNFATSDLASLIILWVAFTFLYLVMPNTQVKLQSALIGGLVGGSLWEIARWLFIYYQSTKEGTVYYDVIYGAFFHLLFLVLWIYYSWVVVLIGSEVACAHQNLEPLSREFRQPAAASEPVDEYLALAVLLAIARRFYLQQPPLSQKELRQMLVHDHNLTDRVMKSLTESNLVVLITGPDQENGLRFLPLRPLEHSQVEDILKTLRQRRGEAVSLALADLPQLTDAVKNLVENNTPTQRQALALQDVIRTLES